MAFLTVRENKGFKQNKQKIKKSKYIKKIHESTK